MNNVEYNIWRKINGDNILMSEMTEDELNKAYKVVQEKQTLLISSLEFNNKLELGLLNAAKKKKIKLVPIGPNTHRKFIVNKFNQVNPVLIKLARIFKTLRNDKSKEAVLQDSNKE